MFTICSYFNNKNGTSIQYYTNVPCTCFILTSSFFIFIFSFPKQSRMLHTFGFAFFYSNM